MGAQSQQEDGVHPKSHVPPHQIKAHGHQPIAGFYLQRKSGGAAPAVVLIHFKFDDRVFSGATEQSSLAIDGVIYRVQGSTELHNWNLEVNEVTGSEASVIQAGLSSLDSGWSHRTFRLLPTLQNESKGFLKLQLDSP